MIGGFQAKCQEITDNTCSRHSVSWAQTSPRPTCKQSDSLGFEGSGNNGLAVYPDLPGHLVASFMGCL